jgi:hypothetical protein
LTLYAADTPLPATNIDWSETGEVIATSSTVNVDDEGRINITAGHDATHFIVGVTGYVMCAVQFVVANPIGVATDATRSLAALGAVALAALIVAALLALGPGWSATRRRPADALKVE